MPVVGIKAKPSYRAVIRSHECTMPVVGIKAKLVVDVITQSG